LAGKDVKNKIVVTDGSLYRVHRIACLDSGAAGVISINSPRPYFDPLELSWGWIGGNEEKKLDAKFAFQIPPREGVYLKNRLLDSEKITVEAKVITERQKYDIQDLTCCIPGTDTAAGEIIFSAHLFEGYVKQGGNDDISGCAAILEVARTLNTLINEGRLARPKRTIRFLWGPEFSGTGPWVKANKALMEKTLCNINMDMVGEWLSKNKSFMCLERTTYGNPHYVNDVVENYYRFVGEGNRERIQNRSHYYAVPNRIVAPTGADEPFYYSVEIHYGASDHEVFNDWAVRVPGIMMIAWPDQWYHTSGDHADKSDPTQLKRTVIIGAASAYTIAIADENIAIKILGEIISNSQNRLGHQLARGIEIINDSNPDSLSYSFATAISYVEAAAANEINTLSTVSELAPGNSVVVGYIKTHQSGIEKLSKNLQSTLTEHAKVIAKQKNARFSYLKLTGIEKKAASIIPRTTKKVKENGYGGYWDILRNIPATLKEKYPYERRNIGDIGELQLLIDGKRSILEIKKMLDAQQELPSKLQDIINYFEILKSVNLIEM
jgi:Peptidase family M28